MADSASGSGRRRSATPLSGRQRSPLHILLLLTLALAIGAVALFLWKPGLMDDGSLFAGRWQFDEETRVWMERTCVDIAFADTASAAVTIEVEDDRAQIRFSDVSRTRLGGTLRRGRLDARQLIPTSEVGRFCGRQTTIDISWRIAKNRPDEIVGRWATPGCDVCPERRFSASRDEQLSP